MRDIITLQCNDCKERNYSTTKNKKKHTERLETKKVLPPMPTHTGASRDEITV
jgi:large subunit ribosomal protein L33